MNRQNDGDRWRPAIVVVWAAAAIGLLVDVKSSPLRRQAAPITDVAPTEAVLPSGSRESRAEVAAPVGGDADTVPLDGGVTPATPAAPPPSVASAGETAGETAAQPTTSTTPAPTTTAPSAATRYDGAVVPTQYGDAQVGVAMSGTQMTDVVPLQLPDDGPRSRQISEDAEVQLRANALQCQCWQVDTVSGATVTSDGYRRSLQSALAQAGRL